MFVFIGYWLCKLAIVSNSIAMTPESPSKPSPSPRFALKSPRAVRDSCWKTRAKPPCGEQLMGLFTICGQLKLSQLSVKLILVVSIREIGYYILYLCVLGIALPCGTSNHLRTRGDIGVIEESENVSIYLYDLLRGTTRFVSDVNGHVRSRCWCGVAGSHVPVLFHNVELYKHCFKLSYQSFHLPSAGGSASCTWLRISQDSRTPLCLLPLLLWVMTVRLRE